MQTIEMVLDGGGRQRQIIAVWFSCGAASAVAAKKTVEKYGDRYEVRIVNSPIAEEDEDNQRFAQDVSEWIGIPIEKAINPRFPSSSAVDVWESKNYMSGPFGAPCTGELKKNARYLWEAKFNPDWHVLGFTFDEVNRHKRFIQRERHNVLPVLIDLKITKKDCFDIINHAGLKLPRIYGMGYPNANCIGCVKASSPTYWNHVRKVHPEIFAHRSEQSRKIGCKLVKYRGKRLFLDELPIDASGRSMKGLDFECGIFCEEKDRHE